MKGINILTIRNRGKAVKSNKEKCGTSLYVCLQAIYTLAEIFSPIVPSSAAKLFKMLNAQPVGWNDCGNEVLKPGHQLNEAEILFKKIEDEVIDKEVNDLNENEVKPEVKHEKSEQITYDEFMKVQLKTAEVVEAEKIEKSEKLLRLKVKIGSEERQVIAGIAKHYQPEEIIGKKVVIVANLKPAKLMGQESQGMILAVESSDGTLKVVSVDDSVETGIRVK